MKFLLGVMQLVSSPSADREVLVDEADLGDPGPRGLDGVAVAPLGVAGEQALRDEPQK